jgi:hypothetical protein
MRAAAMKKNFRICQAAVRELLDDETQKLLLSMVEQPPPPEYDDDPKPPPNLPDEPTQRAIRGAFDSLKRKINALVEDLTDADAAAHKAEVKAKEWAAEVC